MEEYEEDNLENFFRNRAEDDQYEFQEGDWEKMEAKLEAAKLTVGGFSFSKFFWMALGALITSILFIGYIQFTKLDNGTSIGEDLSLKPSVPILNKSLETVQVDEAIRSDNKEPGIKSSGDTQQASTKSIGNPVSNNVQVIDNQPVEYNRVVSGFDLTGKIKTKSTSTNNDSEISYTPQETKKISKVFVVNEVFQSKGFNPELHMVDTIHATYQFSDIPLNTSEIVKKAHRGPLRLKRFYSLGIVAGIDVSSTKESSWGTPIMRLGLSGEYFVTDRLSIGAGLNISEKKYSAKGREYAPPKGFWTNGVVPNSTDAVFQVLDIPITVSYFQPVSRKSSIVFHAGMSSWFILREDYWYKYESNDPDLVSWWGGENENRYWFGVLNMAVSYEYKVSDKWSVLVGPYVNLPLTGIGHGNVKLRSFGMQGSLKLNKYKLQNKF